MEWIPVSKRKPKRRENGKMFLVCTNNGTIGVARWNCPNNGSRWFGRLWDGEDGFFGSQYRYCTVAWMPLPKPYQFKEDV